MLFRSEGVINNEIVFVAEIFQCSPIIAETELVFKDVTFLPVEIFKLLLYVIFLFQETRLNDFICISTRQEYAGGETPLNLGKIIGPASSHLSENGVNIFLGSNNDPSPTAANSSQIFRYGLKVQMR